VSLPSSGGYAASMICELGPEPKILAPIEFSISAKIFLYVIKKWKGKACIDKEADLETGSASLSSYFILPITAG